MCMIRSSVHVKFLDHVSSHRSFREHSFNSKLDNLLRFLCHHLSECCLSHSSNIIGVIVVDLLLKLLTCYFYFLCVYNDHIIACVDVRCVLRFVLSSEHFCNFRSKTSECTSVSVHHIPYSFTLVSASHIRFPGSSSYSL